MELSCFDWREGFFIIFLANDVVRYVESKLNKISSSEPCIPVQIV